MNWMTIPLVVILLGVPALIVIDMRRHGPQLPPLSSLKAKEYDSEGRRVPPLGW
jgi:hypothetical protein